MLDKSAAARDDEWQVAESRTSRRLKAYRFKHIPQAPPLPDRIDVPVLKKTRHDFHPALTFVLIPRRDRYSTPAFRALYAHNIASLNHFLDPLEISQLRHRDQYNRTHGVWTRVFALGRGSFVVTAALFFGSLRSSRNRDQALMVIDADKATDFSTWIENLPGPAEISVLGDRGYELLHQWHKFVARNKPPKHTFSAMPVDIQNEILLHVVGEVRPVFFQEARPNVRPELFKLHGKNQLPGSRAARVAGDSPPITALDPRLLLLNKFITAKLPTILRHWTIKSIHDSETLERMLERGSQGLLAQINRLQLCFTDMDFLSFFGANLFGLNYHYRRPVASMLDRLAHLRYLEIWFEAPVNTGTGNPWWPAPYHFPCRKGMVEAIMLAALPYISQIRKTNLVGCIKTVSRNKWLEYLTADRSPAINARLETDRQLCLLPPAAEESPMNCKCPARCYDENSWCRMAPALRSGHRFDFDDEHVQMKE